MEPFYQALYNYLIYPAIIGGARLASPFHRKVREGFRIHEHALERWKEKASALPADKPRLWFHATSTGEFEAARPVMDLLRERLGQSVSILFSYYSPTVHKTATSYSTADLCEILPLDTRRSVRQVLDWVRPDALIFVRYDTWPNLIWQASARGIRLSLIDALLRKGSFRVSSRLGRSFSRGLYSKFHYIGAAAQSDADRLQYLCGETTTLRLVGDSRLDRVKNRKDRSRALRIPERLRNREEDVLVCGSTWPNDEERIVPALRQLLDGGLRLHAVIAPHEPTRRHLEGLEARLRRHNLEAVRYSDVVSGESPKAVTILDGVGFLAEFYQMGTFVYVGGGFLHSGVHNTMEPAVMGLPLLFGPRIENSPEAEELVRLGAAHLIFNSSDIARRIGEWVRKPQLRQLEGTKASTYIENNLGASQRYCDDLLNLIGDGKGLRIDHLC